MANRPKQRSSQSYFVASTTAKPGRPKQKPARRIEPSGQCDSAVFVMTNVHKQQTPPHPPIPPPTLDVRREVETLQVLHNLKIEADDMAHDWLAEMHAHRVPRSRHTRGTGAPGPAAPQPLLTGGGRALPAATRDRSRAAGARGARHGARRPDTGAARGPAQHISLAGLRVVNSPKARGCDSRARTENQSIDRYSENWAGSALCPLCHCGWT